MSKLIDPRNVQDILRDSIAIDALTYIPTLGDIEYFETMQNVGITATHTTVSAHHDTFIETMKKIGICQEILKNNSKALLVTNSGDIIKAKHENKVGIIMGFQEPTPIGDDLNNIGLFYKEAGRY